MSNKSQEKYHNPFFNFLFKIVPGFLHQNLILYVIKQMTNSEDFNTFREKTIKRDNIQWRKFAFELDNAIYDYTKILKALNSLKAKKITDKSIKSLGESDKRLLSIFKNMDKKQVVELIQNSRKTNNLVFRKKISGEHLENLKKLASLNEKNLLAVKQGKTGLKGFDYLNIIYGKRDLGEDDLKFNNDSS